MERKCSLKTHPELAPLAPESLRAVTGGGRLRVPGGDTDPENPGYGEGSIGAEAEHARIFVPGG